MRIVHIADIHWRGLQRHDEYVEAFTEFFNQLQDINPDLLVVAGDIVHSKTQGITPELIERLRWWFRGLSQWRTVVILGNHDGLIHNRSRLDAISPIISALESENIIFLKESGNHLIEDLNVNLANFSCFDEEGWHSCGTQVGRINIALYHGAVGGSLLDTGIPVNGEVTVDMFRPYDFTLLGDIHRRQFLDGDTRIAYPGSFIQQNYGEEVEKGYLLWNIRNRDEYSVKFRPIRATRPFHTVEWTGDVSTTIESCNQHPNGSRFRISASEDVPVSVSRQVSGELKKSKDATEVVWKFLPSDVKQEMRAGDTSLSRDDLRDPTTIRTLFSKFAAARGLTADEVASVDTTVTRLIDSLPPDERLGCAKWSIKRIQWDNTYSYGGDNLIDFESLGGITGIFGRNAQGKSSIPGTMMYSLFNTTDRGSIKNLHIINTRKDYCKTVIDIQSGDSLYRAERQSVRNQTKAGLIHAITHLNLFRLDQSGQVVEDVSGEQRKDSDKVLRSLIGTSDDFLLTSFASQGEMNTFLKERATARKNILSKFLNLQVFESLQLLAKEDASSIKSELRRVPNFDISRAIDEKARERDDLNHAIEDLEEKRKSVEKHVATLRMKLSAQDPSAAHTLDEIKEQESEVKQITRKIEDSVRDIEDMISQRDDLEQKLQKIQKSLEGIDEQLIRKEIERSEKVSGKIRDLEERLRRETQTVSTMEKSVRKLQEVPCGDSFPTCKFIKDSHKDREELPKHREALDEITESLQELRDGFDETTLRESRERLEKLIALQSKLPSARASLASHQARLSSLEHMKDSLVKDLDREQRKLQEMRAASAQDDLELVKSMKDEILQHEERSKKISQDILRTSQRVGAIDSEIERLRTDLKRITKLQADWKVYETILAATGKDGIPLQIIASQLPRINAEISKILQGVVNFNVEVTANEEEGELDIFIDYGDSRRPIELGSGMEKMMSSLAIRAALIEVSAIPKSDVFIIDEGFGALDDTNIEACARLLTSLKRNFKNMLIISHVDSIKDIVDNVIEISHDGIDARVRCE